MRWKHVVLGLALSVAGAVGCKQQVFVHECDYNHYREMANIPGDLATNADASVQPATSRTPEPSTVLNPEREPRYLTLAEAIAMSLERGEEAGTQSGGRRNDNLTQFTGRGTLGNDSIRAFSVDPAIVGADVEAALSKFDAQMTTSMNWSITDQSAQTQGGFTNGQQATFSSALLKPLPTGGVAGITFSTQYLNLSNPQIFGGRVLSPAYTPRLQFQFEQPLLEGFGVEINQLRTSHPGSILSPFAQSARTEGILITRVRFDQSRAEFQRHVHIMLLNVEQAYWNLYGAYWTLYSQEQALRQSFEAWKINKARYEAGRIAVTEYAQTRQQYELFRGRRLSALAEVLERELDLRALIGLAGEDGTRLVPVDSPTLTPYQPDWNTSLTEAMTLRPELYIARQELKFRQLDVMNQKNFLLPDLRFTSTYGLNGIGNRLDSTENNAFRSLASGDLADWNLGLRLTMPIGHRDAHAQLRVARLNLARTYYSLQKEEQKAERTLQTQYRRLFEYHKQIEIQRSNREAAAEELGARFKEFLAGRGTLDILLEAQRKWADALNNEYSNIVLYNNALAFFEFAKGTTLQHNNVTIGEGPLPQCAQVRAVEHERQRSAALVLRQRANPLSFQPNFEKGELGIPALSGNDAHAVPSIVDINAQFPEIKEGSARTTVRIPPPPTSPEQLPDELKQTPKELPLVLPTSRPK